jgi:hypothetical protein
VEICCGCKVWFFFGWLVFLRPPLGLMEWGFGRTLGRGGVCFVAIPHLFWEMGPGLDFGMMCGAERCLPRKLSQFCMT